MKFVKHSDGNNNDPKSVTPRMSKTNDKQKSTCKITNVESSKASTEVKDKGKFICEMYVFYHMCIFYL